MLKAEESSNWLEDLLFQDDGEIKAIFGETLDPLHATSKNVAENLPCRSAFQQEPTLLAGNHENSYQPQNGKQEYGLAPPKGAEVPGSSMSNLQDHIQHLDSRMGISLQCLSGTSGSFAMMSDSVKLEAPLQIGNPVNSCFPSLSDWLAVPLSECDTCCRERAGSSANAPLHSCIDGKELPDQIKNSGTQFNSSAGAGNVILDCGDHVNHIQLKSEFEDKLSPVRDLQSNCSSHFMVVDKADLAFGKYRAMCGSSVDMENFEGDPCKFPVEASFMDLDISFSDQLHTELNRSQVADITCEAGDHCSPLTFSMHYSSSADKLSPVRDLQSNCSSHFMVVDKADLAFGKYRAMCGSSVDMENFEGDPCKSPVEASFMDLDISFSNQLHAELNRSQVADITCEAGDHCSPLTFSMHYSSSADNATLPSQLIPDSFVLPFVSSMEENMIHIKHQMEDNLLPTQNMCQGSNINLPTQEGTTVTCIQEDSIMDCNGIDICQGMSFKGEASAYCSITGNSSSDAKNGAFADNASRQSLPSLQSFRSSKNEEVCMKDEREDELLVSNSIFCHSVKVLKEDTNDHNSSVSGDAGADNVHNSDAGADNVPSVYNDSRQLLPGVQPFTSIKSQSVCIKEERENILIPSEYMVHHSLKAIGEAAQSSRIGHRYHVDDDADICILEDISDPIRSTPFVAHAKPSVTATHSMYSDSIHHTGFGSPGRKANDERLTFRVALQDLAQPKSEASPPDGVLAVPLLRHQRIALSWMVQKETASVPCSGGILADDQGLGKTVSTIALILKERSPSSKMNSVVAKQGELESLNLDEDDDGVLDVDGVKQDKDSGLTKKVAKGENASMVTKGRPAAGTLIVCPTSVLRQWADELHNKVTKEANLSFLVYHGTNRTKDPYDLAKYDVVLTTYSIVSMEVPKQPLVDKDDDEKGKAETHGLPSMDLSSSRKRKYPPSSDKKTQNVKKGVDGALLESVSRPLARVGWFRVVLDEAQSIKNYRTQVARACWGLRAKRRWCLSGTPIQNAVDDLYSYFRFLRYDPYAVYKSFCSMIKIPINKNPTHGYKKLQAVLKTIMLRRTKGTIIDGKPIITLPLKSIELKKVDFSKEEWDFYSKLEADSRAKFKVYEDAGTVKENYVNILLMLLRLRQACDHPLLVKGYDSSSVWSSSIETAKKLPREKKLDLLNCLEALAICGICNDPPEDAVVTICSHVFCNQCICERLSSDDNLCPAADCKVKLSVTSVFSKATLKCSLSDQSGQGNSNSNFASKLVQTFEPCPEGLSSDSSKIKAALEVLKTLSKPLECTPRDNTSHSSNQSTNCAENGSDSHSDCSFKDSPDKAKVAEKAIVFSQWTRMLDLLEARLKSSSIQYRRLDGTMSIVARDKAVKDFNSLPEVSVMIMSLKAASLGLNMVAACRVLLLDLWWNPTTEDQAIDRAHRIGQTRPVTVLRLTVKDTVEDRILALQQKKREMVASAFGEDETGSCQTRLTVEDLKYLFMV